MSIHKSYFSKNDTLIYNSSTNTGRNQIVELFFGDVENVISPVGYSRFIFDLDLEDLQTKVENGEISTGCSYNLTHKLKMTNTSFFDKELLNDTWSNGRRRATSFDLVLYRIPKTSGDTGDPQTWDEGVGYDYYAGNAQGATTTVSVKDAVETDKSYSGRPVNWFKRTTVNNWSYNGIYDNTNQTTGNTGINYSALTIVDTQHFEFGNEDIEFDMTNEITLTGFVQGRVDIVIEQTYAKEYKAVGWINLQPVFSYQRPAEILKQVADLNRDKFPQFKFQLSMEAVPVFNQEGENVTIYDVDDYDTEFEEVKGEEE